MDMQAVLQYAAKSYGAIGVIGFSLGAGTSLITAARSQLIKSVIAVSAPSDFGKIDYRFWELDFENDIRYSLLSEGRIGKGARPGPFWLPKEKPLTAAAQLRVPVLYIHGTRDWVVKPWHSQALLAQTVSKKRLQVIQDGPHAEYLLRRHREQLIRSSREWFKETL